jgi:hypothetical protein
MAEREGAHVGDAANMRVNRVPSLARASMFGVRTSAFP